MREPDTKPTEATPEKPLGIAVAADHAGYEAKQAVVAMLRAAGHRVTDMGTDSPESCDYPDYAERVAAAVSAGEAERGVLICATGIGMDVAANKFPGVRAAVVWDRATTEVSRTHNDANVLCLGARVLPAQELLDLVRHWLSISFTGGRHQRRVDKIAAIERRTMRGGG
jgi:ribose 5-phosphate isomerase B